MKLMSVFLFFVFSSSLWAFNPVDCQSEAQSYVTHFHQIVVENSVGYQADWSETEVEADNNKFHFFISTGNSRGDYRDYEYEVSMAAGSTMCQLVDFKYLGITDWGYGGGQ